VAKFQTTYYGVEGSILNALYEISHDSSYDTHALAQTLNRDVKPNSPEGEKAFEETRVAVESLIEQGLIKGKRLRRADGVMYYTELNLKEKGEQAAIRYRRDKKAGEKAMAEAVEQIKADEAKNKK
jgi:hypothetical protein